MCIPSLPKGAVVWKTRPVLLNVSVSVTILKSHKEGKWLVNLLILSTPPTRPVKHYLMLQKSVLQSPSLPQHSSKAEWGTVVQDTQWMNILLLLIRSPIGASTHWFNKMKRRREDVCQPELQRTPYGWEGGAFNAIRGRVGSGWCFIRW